QEGFMEMGGTCDSCHFVDNKGDFQMWDFAKYDQYRGFTDLTAEEANLSVNYDQDTITPKEQIFFEGMRQGSNPDSWMTDDKNIDPDIAENWVLTIDGEVENPISMTVPELIEKFGTETVVTKQNCLANGVAGGWIYQAEFTGIPISAILEYIKPNEGVQSVMTVSADDAYKLNLPAKYYQIEDAILVTELNGETLPPSQGYPVATCFPGTSSAYMIKQVEHITFSSNPTPMGKVPIGQLVKDPQTGTAIGMPNSAVLSHPDGVLLEDQAGKELILEGYADGWDEAIKKVEFSLDHGKTWTEMPMTEEYTTDRWVYWRLNVTPPEAGSYLLNIRTTSTMTDGTERVCDRNTQFLFTVS
ncbi:MAG: molybdopterin-dependent oxidoreductase, partial [Raoultibacter sp.]